VKPKCNFRLSQAAMASLIPSSRYRVRNPAMNSTMLEITRQKVEASVGCRGGRLVGLTVAPSVGLMAGVPVG
jgi:hypothetical protein